MEWSLKILPSALKDLGTFQKFDQMTIIKTVERKLTQNPTVVSRNLKELDPNPVAQYELRISDRFRVLYNIDSESHIVTIVLVGEKVGNRLFVQGKEFMRHHEGRTSE
jgi:mRNA-degrading endonuclease RelE of RelBE toxin-antitoxin system